jgi:hypothetical protein
VSPSRHALVYDRDETARTYAAGHSPCVCFARCCLPVCAAPSALVTSKISRPKSTACSLTVYASRPGRPGPRKTRFRLSAPFGRTGFQPAGTHHLVSIVWVTWFPPGHGFQDAQHSFGGDRAAGGNSGSRYCNDASRPRTRECPRRTTLHRARGNPGLEDIPVNQGPKGAKPGARFFADASKGGGVVNFNDAASFDAAAQGHQTYRYDPQGGLDPDVATTLAGLKAAMGQPSGAWQDVVAGAGLANAAAPGDVRLDGTGSSRGLPGGACETCRGSTAAQVVYVAGTALTAVLGAAIAAGENAVASAARSAARISKDVKCYGMCQEFADRLQSALSKKGIGGVRMTIRVRKYGRLVSDTVGPVAETGMLHEAIRVGDTVFDNLRPKGMPLGEFLRDLGLPAPGAAEIAEKAF